MEDAAGIHENLVVLTSDIVVAHVSNNSVAAGDVPLLIQSVFTTLSSLDSSAVVDDLRPEPAVSIRASVKPDHVVCLDCGKKMKMLKRHLATAHGLSIEEYRQRWRLGSNHALVAPNYAATRADLAKKIGLGRKSGAAIANSPAQVKEAEPKPRAARTSPKVKAAPARKARAKTASATATKPAAKRSRKLGLKFAEASSAQDAQS
ncbi:MAG: MucR family transcriptional regulator [Novosphingobium sp.]|nr:MucR family transcriptional regulator [Novosphingobium sp.]